MPLWGAQLARFCLVGFFCFGLNLAALALLHEVLGIHYVVAYVLVFILGNALGYWLNKRFTFALSSRLDHAAMARYLIVNTVVLALSTAGLHLLVERMHVWYFAATALIAAVNVPLTFLTHRIVTYRIA
jgi:putative flippase GtrA